MILASVIDASAIAVVAIAASTYVLTAFCVGNKTSLVPSAVVTDLLAVFSFKSKSDRRTVFDNKVVSVVCFTYGSSIVAVSLMLNLPLMVVTTSGFSFARLTAPLAIVGAGKLPVKSPAAGPTGSAANAKGTLCN